MGARQTSFSCVLFDFAFKKFLHSSSKTLEAMISTENVAGKPKNTGVGSLSLLRGIFPTQELNRGLLHCRWITYQLSYQGSPLVHGEFIK